MHANIRSLSEKLFRLAPRFSSITKADFGFLLTIATGRSTNKNFLHIFNNPLITRIVAGGGSRLPDRGFQARVDNPHRCARAKHTIFALDEEKGLVRTGDRAEIRD